jgi:hypothetical protein
VRRTARRGRQRLAEFEQELGIVAERLDAVGLGEDAA